MNDQAGIQVRTALHETLHLAGKNRWYNDFDFANTVAAMRGVPTPAFADIVEASGYWNAALAEACY
jgi:hypothetical protein